MLDFFLTGSGVVLAVCTAFLYLRYASVRDQLQLAERKSIQASAAREDFRHKLEICERLRAFALARLAPVQEELKAANLLCESLQNQLEQAANRLAEIETRASPDGLLQKAAAALVGMGVPGLVVLAMMATSGFAGAAAITVTLSTLGGPAGMLGGIAVLIALGLASRAVAKYGFQRVADAVVAGLIDKGGSKQSIQKELESYPRLLVPQKVRDRALAVIIDSN